MLDVLKKVLGSAGVPYVELRFHERVWNKIRVTKGELEEATSTKLSGTGIRVLYEGAWGFSSTNNSDVSALNKALAEAQSMAKVASRDKKNRIQGLAEGKPAIGVFKQDIKDPIEDHSLEEKMTLVRTVEESMRKQPMIKSAMSFYREIIDHKFIVTSHGAEAEVIDSKPEFGAMAIASENGDLMNSYEAVGITGGWSDLFRTMGAEERGLKAADMAAKLLKAKHPKGEKVTAILDPSVVGLIAHEAFGHTVEADFVLSGSIAQGKLGKKVASDLVTLVDEGYPEEHPYAGGAMRIDDEGCMAGKAVIIEKGVLKTYLHNKESAHIFGVDCTGNARAFEYSDDPIIRMRNTYLEPGDWKLEEMIKEIKHGYLLKQAGGGQADANAEFMFQVQEPYRIENGEVKELVRGVTMSGQAFDVLSSVDAIGKDFEFDLGSGYCGKFQPAKVDGGGAPLRCKVLVGGVQ
jgi:TldD protein